MKHLKDRALPKLHKSVSVIFYYFFTFCIFPDQYYSFTTLFCNDSFAPFRLITKVCVCVCLLTKTILLKIFKGTPRRSVCVTNTHTQKRFFQINRYILQGLNKLPTDRGHIQDHMVGFNAPLSLLTRKHRFSKNTFLFVPRPDGRGVPLKELEHRKLSWKVLILKCYLG